MRETSAPFLFLLVLSLVLCASFTSASLLLGWGENHLGALGFGDRQGKLLTPQRMASIPGRSLTALTAGGVGITFALDDGTIWVSGHVLLNPQGDAKDVLGGPPRSLRSAAAPFVFALTPPRSASLVAQ